MYSDFKTISTYYDALYVNDREYAPEAAKVKELLTKHGVPSQADLLVLACGTGGHIPYFKEDYHGGMKRGHPLKGTCQEKKISTLQ